MGRRLDIVFLATIAMAVMLQNSSAQTTYTVGDALGWVVPPGSSVYTTWASNKTFRVGDTLVFNFPSGAHNVARVSRANYDACNASSTMFLISNSPANVTLNETGNHYFLCAVPGHCGAGQKLSINVSSAAAPSPSPQPSTPAPQPSSPAPTPASTPQPSVPAPAPEAGSPSPTSATPPTSSSPSPTTAVPPSSTTSPPPPSGGTTATPPTQTQGNSATSLGVTGVSVTFLYLVVAFFM